MKRREAPPARNQIVTGSRGFIPNRKRIKLMCIYNITCPDSFAQVAGKMMRIYPAATAVLMVRMIIPWRVDLSLLQILVVIYQYVAMIVFVSGDPVNNARHFEVMLSKRL